MIDLMVKYLPWLLSAITIWMTLWICASGAWGFLPLNVALCIVYGRNHLNWRNRP